MASEIYGDKKSTEEIFGKAAASAQEKKINEAQILNNFCPFISTKEGFFQCNEKCALSRKMKTKTPFQCVFKELPSISWYLKSSDDSLKILTDNLNGK